MPTLMLLRAMFNFLSFLTPVRCLSVGGLALVGAIAITATLPQEVRAQSSTGADDLGEWQSNERDSRSVGSTGLSPLELIQQIQSLSGQSQAEFDSRQSGRLDDAAESFRRQQQQRLGTPATVQPTGEDATPAGGDR